MIKFIIFEGSDCCGKTTQAKIMCDDKSIKAEEKYYVHFPRVDVKPELKYLFVKTIKTIYDPLFMDSLLTDENDKNFNYLKDVLIHNIADNAKDKLDFLKDIKEKLETETIHKNRYYILDRFYLSGYCYNYYIIQLVIQKFVTDLIKHQDEYNVSKTPEIYKEFVSKTDNIIYKLQMLKKELCDLQTKYDNKILNTLNEISNLDTYDSRTFVFKTSYFIKEQVEKNKREKDEYDKCNQLQQFSRYFFDNFQSDQHRHVIDTDFLLKISDHPLSTEETKDYIYSIIKRLSDINE